MMDKKKIIRRIKQVFYQKICMGFRKKVELFLRKYCKNYSILRIAKTYSDNLNDNTIITKFLRDYVNKKQIFP